MEARPDAKYPFREMYSALPFYMDGQDSVAWRVFGDGRMNEMHLHFAWGGGETVRFDSFHIQRDGRIDIVRACT